MRPFALSGADGRLVHSTELLGHGPLVIYFYPKDETLGCTIEACAFRDEYPSFIEAHATVVGISPDPPESHRQFSETFHLPFALLSDPDKEVFRLYGVTSFLGLVTGRETFVMDSDGVIRHHLRANLAPRRHVHQAAVAVRALAGGRA